LSVINYFKNDYNSWISSNYININKIRGMLSFNLFITLLIPYLGFFSSIFVLNLNAVFFIEYFFEKYLNDTTEVIDISKNQTELSELLIVE
jgi:hypothetical protein